MEMDLAQLPNSGDFTLYAALLNSTYLREIRVNASSPSQSRLTDEGFPMSPVCVLWVTKRPSTRRHTLHGAVFLVYSLRLVRVLRVVELTGSKFITDIAVDRLVNLAPKLRQLALTKCEELTDVALGA